MARSLASLAGLVALSLVAVSGAQARDAGGKPRGAATTEPPIVRELFEAESDGLVEVRFIPNDSRSAQVILKNTSGKPLSLKMPSAFAAVPALGQMGMGGMGGMGMGGGGMGGGGMGGGGMGQGMGGGFGNQGMNGMGGMGGMGGGGMGGMPAGGAFSIPAEKTKVVKVTTVCLEHGKKEPSSRMAYKLVPLDSFSTDPALRGLLEGLARGEMTQKVAQAATWHVANGLSWQELAAKKIDRLGRPDDAWFTQTELTLAHRAATVAAERAAAVPTTPDVSASRELGR